ncbi:N-acetylmuramoyl-L-alanine amidase family protein [Haloferula sp.]|uniref:N-acetylmuramoyl-L-alanine amidase family protein n=1 Tax=Haloferula sp. TaxID=2497595 RepID=UPI003C749834
MTRRIALIRLILVSLLASSLSVSAQWEEKTINGRGYVSTTSIKSYYGFSSLENNGKSVSLEKIVVKKQGNTSAKSRIVLNLRVGSQECLMNGVKFIFTYPAIASGGKVWISKLDLVKLVHPVLMPGDIREAANFRTVIIDPGHGGKDPGATNSLGTEASYNLKVANYLKENLEKLGYKVIMTRNSNRYLTLQQRVDIANQCRENAVFISIHHNSGQSRARGIETFTLSPVGVAHYGERLKASDLKSRTGNFHDSANVALATAVHGMLLTTLKDEKTQKAYTLDRGIKRARFSVLTGVKHPSILVECGFMTHPYEARLINDTGYQKTVAKSIAFAIQRYRAAVSKKG